MARNIRAQLIDAALELFLARGYDATPVQALLEATGASKGAFYHHFTSKEEVLDAVVIKLTDDGVARVRDVVDAAGPSAVARLRALLRVGPEIWVGEPALMKNVFAVLYRADNLRLRLRMQQQSVEKFLPLVASVLEAGTAAGDFAVTEPVETARLILALGHAVGEMQMATLLRWRGKAADIDAVKRRADVHFQSLERIIGAAPRSLGRISKGVFRQVAEILGSIAAPGRERT